MTETCAERLQRLMDEKLQEKMQKYATEQAQLEAVKLAALSTLDVDAEMAQLDAEMDSSTDEELRSKTNMFLARQLAKVKKLKEEKKRRSGG
jgi:predicted esterase YcpF (UPF0227 family)